jgi:zinc protease
MINSHSRALRAMLLIVTLHSVGCLGYGLRHKRPDAPARNLQLRFPMTEIGVRNNATVLLLPQPGADLVSLRLRYQVGAIDDPAGQEGMAHLAEHLMFEMRVGVSTVGNQLKRATVYTNAVTTLDTTDYIAKFEPDKLREVLHLEALRLALRCNTLADEDFARERAVVVAEMKQHELVAGDLYQSLVDAMFPADHAYRRRIGGTGATLAAITKDQACQFINQHYVPNNAVLAISGPVTNDTVVAALAEFSRLPPRNVVPQVETARIVGASRNLTLHTNVEQPGVVVVWPLPQELAARTQTLAVGRLVVQRINAALSDLQGSAFATEIGGAQNDYYVVWIDGHGATVGKIVELARNAVKNVKGFYGDYGFEHASAREVTQKLQIYDDIDRRIQFALDFHGRGLAAPLALEQQLAALNSLNKTKAEEISTTRFNWDEAQIIALQPATDAKRKVAQADFATLADIHAQPPVELGEAQLANLPLALPARTDRLGVIKERGMQNGLTIYTVRNADAPLIDISLVFNTGAATEPAGQRGIAQLAVDSLSMRSSDINNVLMFYRAGGSRYAEATDDRIVFHITGTSAYLDILLRSMERWVLSGTYLRNELRDLLANWKLAANAKQKALDAAVRARIGALYGAQHPYAQNQLSYYDLKALTAENAVAFAMRTFVPSNATLIITGNFDERQLDDWISYVFYEWHNGNNAAPVVLPVRQARGAAFATANEADQIRAVIAYPADHAATPLAVRQIVGAMINEASAAVRNELAASYGVHGDYEKVAAGGSYFTTGLIDAARAGEALQLLRSRIATLGDGSDLAKRTFAVARRQAALAALSDPTSSIELSSVLIEATRPGSSLRQASELPAAIARLTYNDIVPYLATELPADKEVISLTGPKAAVTAAFEALKITPTWQ